MNRQTICLDVTGHMKCIKPIGMFILIGTTMYNNYTSFTYLTME
jgi:hypothetical protein